MLMPTFGHNSPIVLLTPREVEILGLIADGLTAKEIARRLGISVNTVRSHRDNMRHKLGARNTAQLGYLHAVLKSQEPPSPPPTRSFSFPQAVELTS